MGKTRAAWEMVRGFHPAHSETQVEHFIVNSNGLTTYGKLRQALREIRSRAEILDGLDIEAEEVEITLDQVKRSRLGNRRKKVLEYKKLCRAQNGISARVVAVQRELTQFMAIAEECTATLGLEYPAQERKDLELQFWGVKAIQMAALDMLSGAQTWRRSTAEFILHLPQDIRQAVVCALSSPQKKGPEGETLVMRPELHANELLSIDGDVLGSHVAALVESVREIPDAGNAN